MRSSTNIKYTKESLQEAANNSTSFAGVLRYFDRKPSGGNLTHVHNRLDYFGVDYSHFTGQGHNIGKLSPNRKSIEDILVVLPKGSYRAKTHHLRRSMLESGISYICSECNQLPEWNDKPLVLEIDHIDNDWLNNLIDNLRFLCPNCHSQNAPAYSNR